MNKILKTFAFVLSICAVFTFSQVAYAQWPSDLDGGGSGRQQIQKSSPSSNKPVYTQQQRTNTSKKAVQKGMIPKSIFGINFQFPASWIVNDEAAQNPILFLSFLPLADDNSFRDNMLICGETLPQEMNSQEYFDLSLKQLSNSISNFKLLAKGKVTIDGYEGRVIKFTQNANGPTIQQEQLYIAVGNRGYVITISSIPSRFEKSRKDAYKLINTITFD